MPRTRRGIAATGLCRSFSSEARRMSRPYYAELHAEQLSVRIFWGIHRRRRVVCSDVGVLARTGAASPDLLAGGDGKVL